MNGVLNCSILDGWWPEACEHGVNGRAIGDTTSGVPEQDARDASALYEVLETEGMPAYDDRARWVGMMQASIATVSERFSSDRMCREYFEKLYARWLRGRASPSYSGRAGGSRRSTTRASRRSAPTISCTRTAARRGGSRRSTSSTSS